MVTTDFRIKEHMETTEKDGDDVWVKTAEQMGFDALLESLKKDEGTALIPYQKMSVKLSKQFKLLFPNSSIVEEYTHDLPPMEALGLMWYAKNLDIFTQIKIYYHDTDPDPVAVGVLNSEQYLIAAWGDDKVTEEVFDKRWNIKASESLISQAKKAIQDAKAILENPKDAINYFLKNGWIPGSYSL